MPFQAAAASTTGLTLASAAPSLSTLALGAVVGGTALDIIGQRRESKIAEAIAEQNAANLRVQAEQEGQVTQEEQKRIREEGERKKSRLRVLAANAGIDFVGTPLLQAEDIAGDVEEEVQFAGQAGRQRQFGLRFQEQQQRVASRNIRKASPFRLGQSLVTGARRAASLLL